MAIAASFRATLISINILAGAINTIGSPHLTQPTSSKTSKWCSKASTTNISSTRTCKYPPFNPGSLHVHRIVPLPRCLLPPQKQRLINIQNAHALSQIERQGDENKHISFCHTCSWRCHKLYSILYSPQLHHRISMANVQRRFNRSHLRLVDLFSKNESEAKPHCRLCSCFGGYIDSRCNWSIIQR